MATLTRACCVVMTLLLTPGRVENTLGAESPWVWTAGSARRAQASAKERHGPTPRSSRGVFLVDWIRAGAQGHWLDSGGRPAAHRYLRRRPVLRRRARRCLGDRASRQHADRPPD